MSSLRGRRTLPLRRTGFVMKPKLWIALILLLAVAVFSVQNAQAVTVRFLAWHFAISEALVILLAGVLGLIAGLVMGARSGRRRGGGSGSPRA